MIDLDPTLDFIASNARLLDRRRVELAVGDGDPEATLTVLAGYRNPDGGFGWSLEPDSRAPAGQPLAALHAFEVFEEVAPLRSLIDPQAIEGDLDRLEAERHDDGGWDVDWQHWSPAGRLEWRGWATVRAVRILRANGRTTDPDGRR